MHLEKVRKESLAAWHDLAQAIRPIVEPFYEDPAAVLHREIEHCNVAYLARSPEGRVMAFAMFAYEEVLVDQEGMVPALYAGLCASALEHQKRGLVFRLWSHASREAVQWEARTGRRLLAWATTATPVTYYGASMFHDLTPRLDGTYEASSLVYAVALKRRLGVLAADGEHPFVLRAIADSTLYSALERQAIREFCASRDFRIFDELGINEVNGDRLLMIGRFKKEFGRSAFSV